MRDLLAGGGEKAQGAIVIAEPHFGGTGVKIEGRFFLHFGFAVARRKDLDTDLGSVEKNVVFLGLLKLFEGKPRNIGSANTVGGGDGNFVKGLAPL